MKRGYLKTVILSLVVATSLYQCSGCEETKPVKPVGNEKVDRSAEMVDKTRPEWEQIDRDLRGYLKALATCDFDTYLNYANPKLFIKVDRETTKESLEGYEKQGMKSITENVELLKVSPLVTDSASNYAVFWFDAKMRVVFDERFLGDPSGYLMSIADKHGKNNVSYNEESREFLIDRTFKMYGENAKGTEDWVFLDEYFHSTAEGDQLMDFDVLFDLKQFEK